MIEDQLQELTAAVRALTDAIVGYPSVTDALDGKKESAPKKPTKPKNPAVTLDQISEATRDFCMNHSIGAASDILKEFGVKSVKNLAEDQYEDYLAKLNNFEGDD